VTSLSNNPVEVFYSYAHEDENLRDELKKHLANLKRQGVITDWYDRDISAGKEWDEEIKKHLDSASVILLLISPDFMNSDYSNNVEVKRAMQRHEAGEARVIPIILRPVDWEGAPFSKLEALPNDAKPVTSWNDKDDAFLDVTRGIRKAVAELSGPSVGIPTLPDLPRSPRVGFISRRDKGGDDIIEKLRSELEPQKNQLVALWGPGGVGKTTLAAEAVRSVTETAGQRLVWITAEARPNFAFSTLLNDIADQLGRTDLRPLTVDLKEAAVRRLIAAAPTLIALDNLETISPEEEMLCKDFLAKRAQCPVLITTRERIEDAYLIPLAAMAHDEASEFLNRLIGQSPDPDIYLVVDHETILRRAEYNPLIIQWIVAQIDLAQDPDEVLSDLAQGEGEAAQRVFDRSFELEQLASGGRAVLLALALFVPSATRKALAEVAGLSREKDRKRFRDAVRVLSSLWLLRAASAGERLAVEGLTRELTLAHLTRDPRSKVFRERYVRRFLRLAEAHSRPIPEDYDSLETEKDNLVMATDAALKLDDWQSVRRIVSIVAGPADGVLAVHGYWEDATRLNEQAFRMAAQLGFDSGLAIFAHNLAMMRADHGELDEARKLFNESLEISKKAGDQHGIATSLHEMGRFSQNQGELEEAHRLYKQSLEISESLRDEKLIGGLLHQLGTLAQAQGDLSEARLLYDRSLTISRKLSYQGGIAITLHQMADLAHLQKDLFEARRLYHESLEIERKLGNQEGMGLSLNKLGSVAELEGNYPEAIQFFREALIIFQKLKSSNAEFARESLERVESNLRDD
jgi:tetratricopeptide (TPR) repeat protein